MSENLILEGLTLMAMGMGFVLTFLCIMIVAMNIMSKVVGYLNKIFPVVVEGADRKPSAKTTGDDAVIALALAAAMVRK